MDTEKNGENDIEILRDILDRTIGFIRNCDQKTGILLGVLGAVITVLGTQNFFETFFRVFGIICSYCKCFAILYVVSILMSIVVSAVGIYYLVCALKANIVNGSSVKSLLFFGDIADLTEVEYKAQSSSVLKERLREDFVAQIYINASICKTKFVAYGKGFKLGLLGAGVLVAMVIFSNVVIVVAR